MDELRTCLGNCPADLPVEIDAVFRYRKDRNRASVTPQLAAWLGLGRKQTRFSVVKVERV